MLREGHLPSMGILLLLVSWSLAGAQTRPSPHQRRQPSFAKVVDRTSREGIQAKLPPHISTLLALTKEQECPVRQGVQRAGTTVRGLDVSELNKNDVVLFVVDETAKDQTLYLTSPAGKLRKVVSIKAGEGKTAPISDEDRKAFETEKQYWIQRLGPPVKDR